MPLFLRSSLLCVKPRTPFLLPPGSYNRWGPPWSKDSCKGLQDQLQRIRWQSNMPFVTDFTNNCLLGKSPSEPYATLDWKSKSSTFFFSYIIITNNPFSIKLVLCKINFESTGYTLDLLAYFQRKDLQNNPKRKTTEIQLTNSYNSKVFSGFSRWI